jgi:hypothetical protein
MILVNHARGSQGVNSRQLCYMNETFSRRYKIAQSKSAVDKMLSHFITAPVWFVSTRKQ